jgi:tRNA wybutosine-synthesizing protein 5
MPCFLCLCRSAGRGASHLPALYPSLAADVALFDDCGANPGLFGRESYHSSVLRLSSPDTALWAHYDVMDNVLIQVMGTKHILLFPPCAAPFLYVEGSSSRVPDLAASYDSLAATWPAACHALPMAMQCELRPGDALYIPALWFHAVTAGPTGLSAAVNVFFRHLPVQSYDGADPYGNRDLPAGVKACKDAAAAARSLAQLPHPYAGFYARRAAQHLLELAERDEAAEQADAAGTAQ